MSQSEVEASKGSYSLIAQLFHEILAEDQSTIDAAYAAAAHLAT